MKIANYSRISTKEKKTIDLVKGTYYANDEVQA